MLTIHYAKTSSRMEGVGVAVYYHYTLIPDFVHIT